MSAKSEGWRLSMERPRASGDIMQAPRRARSALRLDGRLAVEIMVSVTLRNVDAMPFQA